MDERRLREASRQPHVEGAVTLEHVAKRYGEHVVFDDANASFAHGRIHALMGASGSGKTTLMRLIAGVERADEGRIDGMDGLRRATVFQEDRLCENLSVAANVRMPHAGLKGAEKRAFLERCDDLLAAMAMPGCLARPVRELSGGMKRRVAIARAVLAQADVLFFDEPLKGLDAEGARLVLETITPLIADKTVFWATHREEELALLDQPTLLRVESLKRDGAEA